MNPFFESYVETSEQFAFSGDSPAPAFLNQSTHEFVESNHSLFHPQSKPQTSVSEYPIIPSSQSCDSAQLTQHRSSSYSASVPPRHHSQSGSFVDRSNRFQRGAIATTSTEPFFGGSGSGVASFFRPIHLPRRPISYESLPHPLTQPYQHYKLPFVCPYGIQNFFQSPCPRATTFKQVPASPNLDLVISNVVAVCSVRCHLDLHDVVTKCVNVIFRRDRCVVIMKLRSPRITARIWSSGKITCTGAPCEEEAKIGCRRVARILSKLGYKVRFSNYRIVNILATCTFPYAIKLVKFAEDNKDVEYEPEIHPGAAVKFPDLKVNMRIFSTGSITITAPKIPNIEESVLRAFRMVHKYRDEEEEKSLFMPGRIFKGAMSVVPLLSQTDLKNYAIVPKGPYHSKYKQRIHRERWIDQALHRVRTAEQTDDYLLRDVYDSDSDFSD